MSTARGWRWGGQDHVLGWGGEELAENMRDRSGGGGARWWHP